MAEEVLRDVVIATSSKEVWDSLQKKFVSSTKAFTVQILVELTTSKKCDLSIADFFRKITGLANELAIVDAPLHDEEVLAYLLAGLPVEYDPFVTSMKIKSEALSIDDMFAHLIAFEARRLQHQQTSNFSSVLPRTTWAVAASTAAVVVVTVAVLTMVVEAALVATPSRVVLAATVAPGPSAKSAVKSATPSSNAGTGWMIYTRNKDRRRPWHLQTRTRWIPIGIVIPVSRTTSRAILIALPCVSNTTVATQCKLTMKQVCEFCILVLVQLIPILAPLPSIISFMFLTY
jgi:hypothetical protein